MEERLGDLERQFSQIQVDEVERNAKTAQAIAATERLQSAMQGLTGNADSQDHRLQEALQKVDRSYRDLEMRLSAFEAKLKLYEVQISKVLSETAPKIAEEGKLYEKGLSEAQNNNYLQALGTFQQYLKKYPKGAFAGDAQLWVAECRYALGDFEQAIKDYQKLVEQNPRSPKAAKALLRQGESFSRLQLGSEAKIFWSKLIKDFPNSEEAKEAQVQLEALDKPRSAPPAVPPPAPTATPSEPLAAPPPPAPPAPAEKSPIQTGDF